MVLCTQSSHFARRCQAHLHHGAWRRRHGKGLRRFWSLAGRSPPRCVMGDGLEGLRSSLLRTLDGCSFKRALKDSLAERSKAVAQGAIPKGRGFEPHSCQVESCAENRYATQVSAVITCTLASYTRLPNTC